MSLLFYELKKIINIKIFKINIDFIIAININKLEKINENLQFFKL